MEGIYIIATATAALNFNWGGASCSNPATPTITKNGTSIVVHNSTRDSTGKTQNTDWYGCARGRSVVGVTYAAVGDVLASSVTSNFYVLNFD